MWLLWLSSRGGWLHPVHQGKPHPLQAWLPEVSSLTHNVQNLVSDLALPPQCKSYLHFVAILRNVDWYLVTGVSGQPICLIFKDQAIQEVLKVGPIGFPEMSVTKYQPTLRNIAEDWRSRVLLDNRHAPRGFLFWREGVRSQLLQKYFHPLRRHVTC
jgi:hypothetical protein